jgi:hypothetical protein
VTGTSWALSGVRAVSQWAAKFDIPTAAELDGSEPVANDLKASRTAGFDIDGRHRFSDKSPSPFRARERGVSASHELAQRRHRRRISEREQREHGLGPRECYVRVLLAVAGVPAERDARACYQPG